MIAGLRLDQLGGDADAVGGFAQAAFEHIAYAQFAPNLADLDRPPLVGERRIAGDDEQRRVAR